jgi:hypothetical protein
MSFMLHSKLSILKRAVTVSELRPRAPDYTKTRSVSCISTIDDFDKTHGIITFRTSCAQSGNPWMQMVIFKEWAELADLQLIDTADTIYTDQAWGDTWPDVYQKNPGLRDAEVMVHCECPAFVWWGSQYILTTEDTSVYPQSIAPDPGYPGHQNIMNNAICKHLTAVLDTHF